MKLLNCLFFSAYLLIVSLSVSAQAIDPALGVWKTIDEKTNQPSSLIRLEERNGELIGTVIELIPTPGETLITHCRLCKSERKDKPIVGMVIMNGLKKEKTGHWSGGEILDPEEGDIYKVKIATEDGKTLRVRGYIGISLIGRTQIWVR
ncbi:MAG: DUF2147 domain-containing protein [Betaproteobacteria bacterium]|nr:DUF2147 domain-containing protein [Betaproteobacteria bacterium]